MVLLDILPGGAAVVWDYLNGGNNISPMGWLLILMGSIVYYRERWAIGTEKVEAANIKKLERKKLFDEYVIVANRKKQSDIDLELKEIELEVAKSRLRSQQQKDEE